MSIPGTNKVSFKVMDDRKHFKIIGDASYFRLEDGTPCDNETEYAINTTLVMTTSSKKESNVSKVDYTWDDAKIKIGWAEGSVRPGQTFGMSTHGCSNSTDHPSYSRIEWLNPEHTRYDYPTVSISIGEYGSASCPNVGSEGNFGGSTSSHLFWTEHGYHKFSLTYNPNSKKWSATVYDDNEKTGGQTYAQGTDGFNGIVSKFNLNLSSAQSKIDTAHTRGYFINDNTCSKEYHFDTKSSYTFTFEFNAPYVSNTSVAAYSGSTNSDFNLGKYNPASPARGGIDYDYAVPGTYRYVNSDVVNTQQAGYWVNGAGERVNLEDVGIHLPAKYDYDILPSAQYDSSHLPLRNGMTITVKQEYKGPTGTASQKLELWRSEDKRYDTDKHQDPREYGLTYSPGLVLQVNARSKDSVYFTFDYNSNGIGTLKSDLNCSSEGLGMRDLNILTAESANNAIDRLDWAINKVSMVRDSFGAAQNRLEHKIDNLNSTRENLTSAESRIRDTDMAAEITEYTKNQIISQSSQAMLAQAHSLPQSVLNLIGGKG